MESFQRRSDENLPQLYNKLSVKQFLVNKRLEWAGHVWEAEDSLINKDTENKPIGRRSRGRPRQRWYDTVENVLKKQSVYLWL